MRWFKHYSDNHRGQSIQYIKNKLGHIGVSCYYTLMEMCSEKIENGDEFIFTFNRKYFENILGIKRKSTRNILETFQEAAIMKCFCSENEIKIEMPILLNLLSRDSRKPRCERGASAVKARLDLDLDLDLHKDLNTHTSTGPTKLSALAQIWNENCGTLPKVKTCDKSRAAKSKQREKEDTLENWAIVVQRIANSNFCNGDSDSGWRASFDFLLRPNTRAKVLEGNYDNKIGAAHNQPKKIEMVTM